MFLRFFAAIKHSDAFLNLMMTGFALEFASCHTQMFHVNGMLTATSSGVGNAEQDCDVTVHSLPVPRHESVSST